MGADDDRDCPEHLWELEEVDASTAGAATSSICLRCGAIRYEAGHQGIRPPL